MNFRTPSVAFLLTLGLLSACQTTKPVPSTATAPVVQTPIWQSDAYSLYRDKVVQGQHEGRALSATQLTSNL